MGQEYIIINIQKNCQKFIFSQNKALFYPYTVIFIGMVFTMDGKKFISGGVQDFQIIIQIISREINMSKIKFHILKDDKPKKLLKKKFRFHILEDDTPIDEQKNKPKKIRAKKSSEEKAIAQKKMIKFAKNIAGQNHDSLAENKESSSCHEFDEWKKNW